MQAEKQPPNNSNEVSSNSTKNHECRPFIPTSSTAAIAAGYKPLPACRQLPFMADVPKQEHRTPPKLPECLHMKVECKNEIVVEKLVLNEQPVIPSIQMRYDLFTEAPQFQFPTTTENNPCQ